MKWLFIGEKYPWVSNAYIIFLFGNILFIIGLLVLSCLNSYGLGLWLLILGMIIMAIILAITFIFYKIPYLTALATFWCFQFVIINCFVGYKLFYNTKILQEYIDLYGGPAVDISILKWIFIITTIIFILICVLEATLSVHLYRKFGREWVDKLRDIKRELGDRKQYPQKERFITQSEQSNEIKSVNCPYCNRTYKVHIKPKERKCPYCNNYSIECNYCSTLYIDSKIRCPNCNRFNIGSILDILIPLSIYGVYGGLIWFMFIWEDIFGILIGILLLFKVSLIPLPTRFPYHW